MRKVIEHSIKHPKPKPNPLNGPTNSVSIFNQLEILKIAQSAILEGDRDYQIKNSFSNCHHKGVFSLLLTPTIRSFCTDYVIPYWANFDFYSPHRDNDAFLLHKHRYPISSIPLEGTQYNAIYREKEQKNSDIDPQTALYKKLKFKSERTREEEKQEKKKIKKRFFFCLGDFGILTGELSYTLEKIVPLELESLSLNEAWFMKEEEIHRIIWPTPIISLIQEHRDPLFIDEGDTDAYQSLQSKESLCSQQDELYQPLSERDFDRFIPKIQNAILLYQQKLQKQLENE